MNNENLHQRCLICNGDKFTKVYNYEQNQLVKCNKCSFVFFLNIPTTKELTAHYDGYGRNDYLSEITIKRFNTILDQFEKYRKTNRLLDVGCGIGYFLYQAKTRGWEVYGTEFTDKAVEICSSRGIEMFQGPLKDAPFTLESFDVIVSIEVLEHINNPQEEVRNFNKLLRKGGLVYLTTPNYNSYLRNIYKKDFPIISYPEHLTYYTAKTLKKLFTQSGFSTKKIETTGISFTLIKNRIKKNSHEHRISSSSSDEKIRGAIENKKYLQITKAIVNSILTFLRKGDAMKGWFVKEV